jgi:hypothetical protein
VNRACVIALLLAVPGAGAAPDTAVPCPRAPLQTRWAAAVKSDQVWPEYPRPQLVREAWQNLNGIWDYAITPPEAPRPTQFPGTILVPFPLESALSGVM